MKIDSMDAVNTAVKVQETVPKIEKAEIKSAASDKNLSQMTELEKRELSISDKAVIDAIEKANKAISTSSRKFEYSIHEKTKEIMIKVIDSETNEVIREIPPEKILDMVARMWEMAGLIVDERR